METRPFKPKLPEIAESEQTPVVRSLWQVIADLQAEVQRLEDAVRRLKGGPPRPPLKPNPLEAVVAAAQTPPDEAAPRRGHPHRAKTAELVIHETCWVELEAVPAGAQFQGYRSFVVQDVVIELRNVNYERAQWRLPSGESVTAPVPLAVAGHYGPQLIAYLLPPHYHAPLTQPILLAQVREWRIQISAGQLNHLLTEGHEGFHQEKALIKTGGLRVSSYLQADDTGARHQGQNGYTTYLGNAWFAWFASPGSKSRVNFLELLQTERCYAINPEALAYMTEHGVAPGHVARLATYPAVLTDADAWATYLRRHLIDHPRAVALVTEGALLGGLVTQGFRRDLRLLSDDAGQFALFTHALCWVHAERPLQHLVPPNEADRQVIAQVRERIWTLYRELTAYRQAPTAAAQAVINVRYDTLCATVTSCEPLNQVLRSFQRNRDELLRVLDHPGLPLHNNGSENDIRDMVKKRKISAGTRSEAGRRCRDTFISLKKTCRKRGISFWEYLCDRVAGRNQIPQLPDLIRQAAAAA